MKELTKRDITEYCLLAALLNDDDGTAWKEVDGYVTKDMFKYEGHKIIFTAIEWMRTQSPRCSTTPIDVVMHLKKDVAETRIGQTRLLSYMTDICFKYWKTQDPLTGNLITVQELITQLQQYNYNGYTLI